MNLPQVFSYEGSQTDLTEASERIVNALRSLKKSNEEQAKRIFGDLSDSEFGEVFHTVQHFNVPMRACIYFIKNEHNGLIKIGKTNDLPRRLKQIESWFYQCGIAPNLKIVMLHLTFPKFLTQLESDYHKRLANKRRFGEWFQVAERQVTNINNFGDGFAIIGDSLVCFEELERLALKKGSFEYDLGSYIDDAIKEPLTREYIRNFAGLPQLGVIETFFKNQNKTLCLLQGFFDKEVCVRTFNGNHFRKTGRANTEPISFADLKRHKFFNDYAYWESILLNQKK